MVASARTSRARNFFSKHGILSRWHERYEFRAGQLEMAEAVEAALAEDRHLIVEAGTGTGKTLAYLVPAILSGKRVIVSTGTRNLQEQLFYKDVPFLQKHLETPLRVCYMKGRSNYACRQKIYDQQKGAFLTGLEEVADFQIIQDWEPTTETGDRAEIHRLPENSTAWAKIDARREMCTGSKCLQYERCFLTLMHQRAAESDIIIVNHHLFFADLALRNDEFGGVLPAYDAVIFDEAHEIEDIAGQYFGTSVSNTQLDDLRRDVAAVARQQNFASDDLDRILIAAQDAAERFFKLFGAGEGRTPFSGHSEFLETNSEAYLNLLRAVELIHVQLQLTEHQPEEALPLVARAKDYSLRLQFWMEKRAADFVYYVERRGRSTWLHATPIDVAQILDSSLFDRVKSVILTSATLAVGGNFDFTSERLGLRGARTLLVDSPFDYPKQALLYAPQHLPEPRSPAFTAAAADEITSILELSSGRAFVLFTSYAHMRPNYDRVSLEVPFPTLLQGTAPRNSLLQEFRSTPNCVLFATSSFWQGVDVQGEQLSCVIIDKLPFAVPSDPVVEARVQAVREHGGNPFYEYQIPQAALALKQGFGRLIRSRSDRGVLAILDHRITKQRYGQIFFDSLPDYAFTTTLKDVAAFFADAEPNVRSYG
ncbi:MAG TPA: ATP-dependent DNA helicase [Bryobacteraceae bacterium]|nr:ATP-dependent DNA helicase [Bryobacteraceae bacterium]